ncbi:MAG: hypothetical protein LBJ16_03675 [Holosporaceae bacterium]|nr:hypothetical protein [Holosporaceae bacterium]
MRSFGNFCVASVLGSSCTTCTLRSCAPYAHINSSKYLCFERSLMLQMILGQRFPTGQSGRIPRK